MNAIEHVAQTIEQITRKPTREELRKAKNRRYYEANRYGFYIRRRVQDLVQVARQMGVV
jgi:hypothetical protein